MAWQQSAARKLGMVSIAFRLGTFQDVERSSSGAALENNQL